MLKILIVKLELQEWEMLSFLRSLKSMLRSSNAVAVVTFPPSLLLPSISKRWQHMADTLLSVRAIPGLNLATQFALSSLASMRYWLEIITDEDKELAKLLTGYQDMVGLLNVHKVAQINTQVCIPVIWGIDWMVKCCLCKFFTSSLFCIFLLGLVHSWATWLTLKYHLDSYSLRYHSNLFFSQWIQYASLFELI